MKLMRQVLTVYLTIAFCIGSYAIIWDDTKMKTTTEDFVMTTLWWGPLLVVAIKDGTFKTFIAKQTPHDNLQNSSLNTYNGRVIHSGF